MTLQQHYDSIWQRGRAALAQGEAELDLTLNDMASDTRQGMTLVLRPSPEVQASCQALLHRLAQAEPNQYCYQPQELHVTVLSLFTANPNIAPYLERLPRYQAALQTALADTGPCEIIFRGVTASPAAVLVQGFPVGSGLEQLRERLRTTLAQAGFGADLDQRYRIRTAHMTLLRFCSPLHDAGRFVELLAAQRDTALGALAVCSVQLVQNDWYMSAAKTRTLAEYSL